MGELNKGGAAERIAVRHVAGQQSVQEGCDFGVAARGGAGGGSCRNGGGEGIEIEARACAAFAAAGQFME